MPTPSICEQEIEETCYDHEASRDAGGVRSFGDNALHANRGERPLDHREMWRTEGVAVAANGYSESNDSDDEPPETSGRAPEALSDPRLIGSLVQERPFNLDLMRCATGNSPEASIQISAKSDKHLIKSLQDLLS